MLGNLNDLVPYSRQGLVRFLDTLGNFAPQGEEVSFPGEVTGELLGHPHLEEEFSQRILQKEARAGLSLRELKARVRAALKREKASRPWHREVGERLLRLDLEALPPERRERVEELLAELERVLEGA